MTNYKEEVTTVRTQNHQRTERPGQPGEAEGTERESFPSPCAGGEALLGAR